MFLVQTLQQTAWRTSLGYPPAGATAGIEDPDVTAWTKEKILLELGNIALGLHLGSTLSLEQRVAAEAWNKLIIQCDLSYPSSKALKKLSSQPYGMEYAVRHAIAAYPPMTLLVNSLIASHRQFWDFAWNVVTTGGSTRKLMQSIFGIEDRHIVTMDMSTTNALQNDTMGTLYKPAYYLVVDTEEQKIVLSVRGSTSAADWLTDLDAGADAESFDIDGDTKIDGYVHPGIYLAASELKKRVDERLIETARKYEDYQVIITGHSLGAGTAAMLAFLYRNNEVLREKSRRFPNGRLRCFAFACPAVVSREFMEKKIGADFITTVRVGSDMVPTFSVSAAWQMVKRFDVICEAMKEDSGIIDKCIENFDTMNRKKFRNERWYQLLQDLIKAPSPEQNRKLFPLGKMLWFVPKEVMVEDDQQRRKSLQAMRTAGSWAIPDMIRDWLCWTIKTFFAVILLLISCVTRVTGLREIWTNLCLFVSIATMKGKCRLMASDKYDGSNYVLCDASNCTDIFQEFVFDFRESIYAHLQIRYLMACGARLDVAREH